MSNDEKKSLPSHFSYVTIALVLISSFLRIIVGNSDKATKTISFLNLVMMGYLLFRIFSQTYIPISDNKINDNVRKNQINAYTRLRRLVWFIFLVFSLFYLCIQFIVKNEGIFCIANDILALITFGVSIEEENIENLIITYFKSSLFM